MDFVQTRVGCPGKVILNPVIEFGTNSPLD